MEKRRECDCRLEVFQGSFAHDTGAGPKKRASKTREVVRRKARRWMNIMKVGSFLSFFFFFSCVVVV